MRVLVTNAEDWISLEICRSLRRQGIVVGLASHDHRAMSFSSRYAKKKHVYTAPSLDENMFIEDLVSVLKNENYDHIIPTNDTTLMALSSRRTELEPYVNVPLASHQAIEACDDKSKTIMLAEKKGLPCPKTRFIDGADDLEDAAETIGFPLVIKPHRGQGGNGIAFVSSKDELSDSYSVAVKNYGPAMIQEYIQGEKYLLAALLNEKHEPRRASVHKVIRNIGGLTIYGETASQQSIVEHGLKLLSAAGLYGMAEADYILDKKDGLPKLMEINPRFFGSLAIHTAAGIDYPYLLCRMLMEGDIQTDMNYKTGIRSRHLLKDTAHLITSLSGRSPFDYDLTKKQTLINYLTSFSCRNDYILSMDDPGPGLNEIRMIFARRINSPKEKQTEL